MITKITYPDGKEIDYTYNSRGLLESIPGYYENTAGKGFVYDATGNTLKEYMGNGEILEREYDARNRIERQFSGTHYDYNYAYYNNSNIKTIKQLTTSGPKMDFQYEYDGLNRLQKMVDVTNSSKFIEYGYDGNGNRIALIDKFNNRDLSYQYPNNNNQLIGMNNKKYFEYDANGNTIVDKQAKNNAEYVFDYRNRMIEVKPRGWELSQDQGLPGYFVTEKVDNNNKLRIYTESDLLKKISKAISRETNYPQTFSLTEYIIGDHDIIQAAQTITSTATIGSKGNVILEAGEEIRLKPGTRIVAGANFTARINPALTTKIILTKQDIYRFSFDLSRNNIEDVSEDIYVFFGDMETQLIFGLYYIEPRTCALFLMDGKYKVDQFEAEITNNQFTLKIADNTLKLFMDNYSQPVAQLPVPESYTNSGEVKNLYIHLNNGNYTLDNLMATKSKEVIINETFDKKIHEYHRYTYNDNNERILKQSPKKPEGSPSETYYVYDGNGNVLTEYLDGQFEMNYVFANSRRAMRLHGDGSHEYFHTNYLGSSILITSDLKSVWSRSFYPFGGEMEASGDGNKYGFTGKERDRETGLDYFWNRYYDKDLGRFRSVDPLWHKYPTLSSYQYCDNNPMMYVDPTGESATIAVYNLMMTDLAVPDPTDVAVAYKAAGYAVALGGASIIDYFIAKKAIEQITNTETTEDSDINQTSIKQGKKAKDKTIGKKSADSNKNEKHGKQGKAIDKAKKQIDKLNKDLKNAKTKKEKDIIKRKIKKVRESSQKKDKGTEHSRVSKRR